MKALAALCGVAGSCLAFVVRPSQPAITHVVLLGNHLGYLSPCGCTSPMSGGILRQSSEINRIKMGGPSILIDSGNLSAGDSEQERLKAETLAQTLGALKVDAVNLTYRDANLGIGEIRSNLDPLSGGAWLSSSIRPSGPGLLNGNETVAAGRSPKFGIAKEVRGFLVGGVSVRVQPLAKLMGAEGVEVEDSVDIIVTQAKERGLNPILMVDGSRSEAVDIAASHPDLCLVIYNSTSRPSGEPEKIGHTPVVASGERGEYLLDLSFGGSSLLKYQVISLGENVPDDPKASGFYKTYLKRVSEDHLWEKTVRINGPAFAGSEKCQKCHTDDYRIWKSSAHAQALHTLAVKGHQLDPECLPCHVTGAKFKAGFRSSQLDPQLASVGCESCHGAGALHAKNPRLFGLPKVKPATCEKCHEELNSPNFDYGTYWPKIAH